MSNAFHDFLRQKESVTLENETNQMAERLQALREQMNREKELRDAAEAQKVSQLLKRIVILIFSENMRHSLCIQLSSKIKIK
jgi:uncharacterized membrane protein